MSNWLQHASICRPERHDVFLAMFFGEEEEWHHQLTNPGATYIDKISSRYHHKLTHIRIMFQKSQPRLLYLGSCFLAYMFAYVCWSELLRSQANCDPLSYVFTIRHWFFFYAIWPTPGKSTNRRCWPAGLRWRYPQSKKRKSVCQLRTLVRNVQGRLQREGVEKVAM